MEDKKFEDLMNELEMNVKKLENGEIDLDSSIETYSEAMKLAKICGDRLTKATESVNKILMDNGEEKDFKVEE